MVLTAMKERAHSALRVALNMNNAALVQRAGDGYTGLAIRIAERISAALGAPLIYVEHPNAQSVLQAEPDGWDIAFLAIDPSRTDRIAFSDPYHSVEATFAVRDALAHRSCAEILQGDHIIMSANSAAYQARLSALAPKGPLVVAASPNEARQRFCAAKAMRSPVFVKPWNQSRFPEPTSSRITSRASNKPLPCPFLPMPKSP
jgi:polar amino acid transport system substrate-binding protein